MLGKSAALSTLEQNLKIQAMSLALQKTGVPKDQAIILARQQFQGAMPQLPMQASTGFGGFDMSTILLIGGAVLVGGIAYFAMTKRSKNVRRRY